MNLNQVFVEEEKNRLMERGRKHCLPQIYFFILLERRKNEKFPFLNRFENIYVLMNINEQRERRMEN